MSTILEAYEEAKRILLGKPGIYGISYSDNRIIVYAVSPIGIPTSILGFPVEVIITRRFEVL